MGNGKRRSVALRAPHTPLANLLDKAFLALHSNRRGDEVEREAVEGCMKSPRVERGGEAHAKSRTVSRGAPPLDATHMPVLEAATDSRRDVRVHKLCVLNCHEADTACCGMDQDMA